MNLKDKIKDKGLKMKWIAEKVGVHHTLLSMYLNNARPMPEHIEKKIKEIVN